MKISGKMSHSSRLWMNRQRNDPYVKMANKDGYRSRAAFKLMEIDEKFNLVKSAKSIVDLGAAPGGWSQFLSRKLSSKLESEAVKIVAVDLIPFATIEHVNQIIGNFEDETTQSDVIKYLGDDGADLIVSDMAPSTTGHAQTDHLKIMRLVEEAYFFAQNVLKIGGVFVAKIFQGGEEKQFADILKKDFEKVCFFKPKSSRSMSVEIYIIAMGFKKCR